MNTKLIFFKQKKEMRPAKQNKLETLSYQTFSSVVWQLQRKFVLPVKVVKLSKNLYKIIFFFFQSCDITNEKSNATQNIITCEKYIEFMLSSVCTMKINEAFDLFELLHSSFKLFFGHDDFFFEIYECRIFEMHMNYYCDECVIFRDHPIYIYILKLNILLIFYKELLQESREFYFINIFFIYSIQKRNESKYKHNFIYIIFSILKKEKNEDFYKQCNIVTYLYYSCIYSKMLIKTLNYFIYHQTFFITRERALNDLYVFFCVQKLF
ncbi:hypothetical protein RFI_14511 [Reticulomyxa filosa]|uniref:Uncharacterized protein n=1 Tax=Reticulomyxa filosa TaxID=46433 RepID=X6N8Q8_RETFI|nr:hypothetical protein RFI_14511 [Reticulomyxa filosa]|eukprot:ETO22680.1 hypothetical protein RFI_14511 [Reticulomyxa filosa]